MELIDLIMLAAVLGLLLLWFAWVVDYGFWRGTLAMLCRVAWLLPIGLAFYPVTRTEPLPRTLALKPLNILLDDSQSMSETRLGDGEETLAAYADRTLDRLTKECVRIGCLPKVTRLSEVARETRQGLTPLSRALEPWLYGTGGDPWIVVSDGGDFRPSEPWDEKLRNFGRGSKTAPRGLILGFRPSGHKNLWLDVGEAPLFSFEEKPLTIQATLKREKPELGREAVQVQVLSEDKALATLNAIFEPGEKAVELELPIPALPRGQHLLTIKALPTGEETATWDNDAYKIVEVLPNTVGVLHLLGAPSWDGRFLRRYLKSEPKYDLISFFILRDPGDMQLVNERELSLIPFPVDRLFNEELPNFHVVAIQNFTLFQFLEPTYQKNLVDFVQNGGGLLFVGGPRALQAGDYENSPLAMILPFETKPSALGSGGIPPALLGRLGANMVDPNGPYYDEDLKFTVELADPSATERSLANVFDDWEQIRDAIEQHTEFVGLHHMENVKFKDEKYTPLLNARLTDGRVMPLAVASYPGKGRALWIFSDSFWRLAMSPGENASREVYHDFMQSAMTWLLRQELDKPLIVRNLHLTNVESGMKWHFNLIGPAARYFGVDGDWRVEVCGTPVSLADVTAEKNGPNEWQLSGSVPVKLAGGARCRATVEGNHPAFGSVRSTIATVIPEVYSDRQIVAAPNKLESLADLTRARLVFAGGEGEAQLNDWLAEITGTAGVALPSRVKTIQDFYWVLDRWWFWLLVLALPLEVVVRRWPQLTAGRGRGGRGGRALKRA